MKIPVDRTLRTGAIALAAVLAAGVVVWAQRPAQAAQASDHPAASVLTVTAVTPKTERWPEVVQGSGPLAATCGVATNEAPADRRLPGSIAFALKGAEQGAQVLRVHDVPETVQALRIWRGMRDQALTPRQG